MLVGGIAPKMELSPSKTGEEYVPIPGSGTTIGQKSLQLNPILFKKCTGIAAMSFLLDRSSSMNTDNKIGELKKGVLGFTSKLSDDSVIGIQDFSDELNPRGEVNVLVPFSYYKDVKDRLPSLVNNLTALGNTHTKSALAFTKERIREAQAQYPKYKFSLLFLSDGQPVPPETQTPSTEGEDIKKMNVRIFTIAYGASAAGVKPLMLTLASSPGDAFYAPDPKQIEGILNQIATKMCDTPAQ